MECPSADDSGISYEEHTSSPKQSPDLIKQRLSDSSSFDSSSRDSHISAEDNQPTVLEATVASDTATAGGNDEEIGQLTNGESQDELPEVDDNRDEVEEDVEELLRTRHGEDLNLQHSHCSSLSDTVLVVDPLLIKIPEPPLLEVSNSREKGNITEFSNRSRITTHL